MCFKRNQFFTKILANHSWFQHPWQFLKKFSVIPRESLQNYSHIRLLHRLPVWKFHYPVCTVIPLCHPWGVGRVRQTAECSERWLDDWITRAGGFRYFISFKRINWQRCTSKSWMSWSLRYIEICNCKLPRLHLLYFLKCSFLLNTFDIFVHIKYFLSQAILSASGIPARYRSIDKSRVEISEISLTVAENNRRLAADTEW